LRWRRRAVADARIPNLSVCSMPFITPSFPGLWRTLPEVSLRLSERTTVFQMVSRR